MSHLNPNLYKRVGLLDLSYLLAKGRSNAYPTQTSTRTT